MHIFSIYNKIYFNIFYLKVRMLKFLTYNKNLFEYTLLKKKIAKTFNLQYIIDGGIYKFSIYNI